MMLFASTSIAGDLQPAAPPAPTMHTLGEIYDQIQALSGTTEAIPSDSIFGVSTGINMSIDGGALGDIHGNCTIAEREDTIVVVGFEHDLVWSYDPQGGLPSGHRAHQPFVVLKYFDRATPLLYNALASGTQLAKVEINFYRKNASNAEVLYYTIELENVRITQIGSSTPNFEKISFVYERITWTHEDGGISFQDDWYTPQA
jgi:type VI secretion system secreted protein Hcp